VPPWLRYSLAFSVFLNVGGALLLSPLWPNEWLLEGTPHAPSLHAWLLSSAVFGFGVAYGWMAWTKTVNRGVLALACYGKLTFAFTLFAHAAIGELPWTVGMTGLPDLLLGALFAGYLLRDPAPGGPAA
jgi:hypothetical protein